MPELLLAGLAAMRVVFRNRAEASLEVLALRQQVAGTQAPTTAADTDLL